MINPRLSERHGFSRAVPLLEVAPSYLPKACAQRSSKEQRLFCILLKVRMGISRNNALCPSPCLRVSVVNKLQICTLLLSPASNFLVHVQHLAAPQGATTCQSRTPLGLYAPLRPVA